MEHLLRTPDFEDASNGFNFLVCGGLIALAVLTDVYRSLQLTEDVARKKAEYQKHLDYYKQLRMRFEEHYLKCE